MRLSGPTTAARLRGLIAGGALTAHASVYVVSAALSALIPFLLLPFLTRWLGPTGFGIVGSFLAVVNVLAILAGLNTHGLVSIAYFQEGQEAFRRQVGASVGVATATALALALLVMLLGRWVESETGIAANMLWTAVIAAEGSFIMALALAITQTTKAPFRFAAIQLGYGLILAGLTILLVGIAGMDWTGRAVAQAVAAVAVSTVALIWLTHEGSVDWRPAHWPIRKALAFGLPLIPHSLAAMAMITVDRLALGSAAGPAEVGHYFAAFQIASAFTVFGIAVNQAWQPWLYERLSCGDAAALCEVIRATYVVGAMLVLCTLIVVLAAPLIIAIMAGPGFAAAVIPLQLLAPAFALQAAYYFLSGPIFYKRRTGLLALITMSTAALQATLVFTLAPMSGAIGVALATLIASFYYALATGLAAQSILPMPWRLGRLASQEQSESGRP